MKPNLFNSVKMVSPPTNAFNLSHDKKLSLDMGKLIPIACKEALPGDIWGLSCESLLRFAPMVAPVMDMFNVTMHYYFVPCRLLWPNWENFITNTKIGEPEALPVAPYFNLTGADTTGIRTLWDYLGLPIGAPADPDAEKVSALPFAAYQLIYDQYYRDQNLIDSAWEPLADGSNNAEWARYREMRYRAWPHDYLTSCLPFAQKGDAVDIPLGDVELKDVSTLVPGQGQLIRRQDTGAIIVGAHDPLENTAGFLQDHNAGADILSLLDPNQTWQVEATTVNDLRLAMRLQEFLEKNARGGTRYIENILAHFGVKSSDKRLNRPEYITGVKSPVRISEVLNTAGGDLRPQGDMAGHGAAVTTGNYGKFFCEEHGFIMCIMSVIPNQATYQQGIEKMWLRLDDPTQYYWPSFAHIGEQEVLKKEVMGWQGATGNQVFGYNPRFSEYKFANSSVAGDFRDTLDHWTVARQFASMPSLNQEFIECKPTKRIFAVADPDIDSLWCHVYHKMRVIRRMPVFGIPTF